MTQAQDAYVSRLERRYSCSVGCRLIVQPRKCAIFCPAISWNWTRFRFVRGRTNDALESLRLRCLIQLIYNARQGSSSRDVGLSVILRFLKSHIGPTWTDLKIQHSLPRKKNRLDRGSFVGSQLSLFILASGGPSGSFRWSSCSTLL